MINEELAYRIGYGNTRPQLGYGQAQVFNNDMATGVQRGIQNFDVWQQRKAKQDELDKQRRAKVRERRNELLSDVDASNPFKQPTLNAAYSQALDYLNDVINSDPEEAGYENRVKTAANEVAAFKQILSTEEERFLKNISLDDYTKKGRGSAVEYFTSDVDGDFVVDLGEGFNWRDPQSRTELLRTAASQDRVYDLYDLQEEITSRGSEIKERFFENPDLYREKTVKDGSVDGVDRYVTVRELTPEAKAAFKSELLGYAEVKSALEQEIDANGLFFGDSDALSKYYDSRLDNTLRSYYKDSDADTYREREGGESKISFRKRNGGWEDDMYNWSVSTLNTKRNARLPQTIRNVDLGENVTYINGQIKDKKATSQPIQTWSIDGSTSISGKQSGIVRDNDTGEISILVNKKLSSAEQNIDLTKQAYKKIAGYEDMSELERNAAYEKALVDGTIKIKTEETKKVPFDINYNELPLSKTNVYEMLDDDRAIESPEMANDAGYSSVTLNNGDVIDMDTAFMLYSGDKNAGESFGEWMFRTKNKFSDEQISDGSTNNSTGGAY